MEESVCGNNGTSSSNYSSSLNSSCSSRSSRCLNENLSKSGEGLVCKVEEDAVMDANRSESFNTRALQAATGNRHENVASKVSKSIENHERQVATKSNVDSLDFTNMDKLSHVGTVDVTGITIQLDKATSVPLAERVVKRASNAQIVEIHQKSSENLSNQNKSSEVIKRDRGKHTFPASERKRKESEYSYASEKRDDKLRKSSRSSSRERQHQKRRSNSKFRSRSRGRSVERRRKERERRHAEQEANRSSKSDQNSLINTLETKDSQDEKGRKESALNSKESLGNISERQRRTVDLLTSRTGGAYIPPAKLRLMQAEITDKSSAAYQRIAWEALKKSIHGYINKVNVDNIAIITRELLKENIVRGRGLLCRSIIQAQAASPTFTHVYAALVAIINSKFPNIGELLLKRLVIQFKRAFRRNDKNVCLSSSRFIAHLVNQRVAHEILALEILTLLVETPTDDSVEVAIAFLKEVGMKLTEVSSKGIGAIFEMLKNILHEGKLDKRVQYMIEVVFQVRKDGFKDHQSVLESLELVEEDDQFTHLLMLDEATNQEDALNAFKFDEKYETNEDKYKGLSKEILGSDESESGNHGSESDSNANSNDSDDSDEKGNDSVGKVGDIIDNTETNMIALRRTIYLTINSSLDYEECAHKLMKMQLKPGQEIELCHMFLDCCAEQRTYEKFYGLLAQRFCAINKIYIEPFEEIFRDTYQTTHRLDTNRLRNVSKFFAHLLFTDAVGWDILECIKLNEDDTTSSSRIFIKILFQELAEYMGLGKLNSKLKDEVLKESLTGLFPKDNPRNTRFAINFFTSIGLGGLTDELRQFLKNTPKSVPAINLEILADEHPLGGVSSSTSTTTTDSSASSSESSNSSSFSSTSTTSGSSSESSGSKYRKSKKRGKLSDIQQMKNKKKKVEKRMTKQTKRNKKKSDESSSEEIEETTSKDSDGSHNRMKRYKSKQMKKKNEDENIKKLTKDREVKISKRKYNSKEDERLEEERRKIRRGCGREMDNKEDKRDRDLCNDGRQSQNKSRDYSRKLHASRYSKNEVKHGKSSNDKGQRLKVNSGRNGSKERG